MNNLIIIQDDSSSEEIIPARCSRVSSKAEKDICKSNTSSQELSSDETSEEFTQIGIEYCSICLQFFDKNTDWLPWGHIFHHRWIFTQQGRLWIGKCPLLKGDVDGPQDARKLCVDPNELGGERMNTLLQSNRRLEKQIRKITSEHETLKERLEAKDKKIYLLKTIMKQKYGNWAWKLWRQRNRPSDQKKVYRGDSSCMLPKWRLWACTKVYKHSKKFKKRSSISSKMSKHSQHCKQKIY